MPAFVILSSDANLVEAFDDEAQARSALEEIARQDPEHADEYALLIYDDDGHPVGDGLPGSHLGVSA
jgi:hypothetical protein